MTYSEYKGSVILLIDTVEGDLQCCQCTPRVNQGESGPISPRRRHVIEQNNIDQVAGISLGQSTEALS